MAGWRGKRLRLLQFYLSWGLNQTQIASQMDTSQQVVSYQKKQLRKRFYAAREAFRTGELTHHRR